jgi:hypothetical protein
MLDRFEAFHAFITASSTIIRFPYLNIPTLPWSWLTFPARSEQREQGLLNLNSNKFDETFLVTRNYYTKGHCQVQRAKSQEQLFGP